MALVAAVPTYSYSHQNANGTTTVKSGQGVLHAITINTKGATGNTATIYDNTAASGTIVAVIDTTSQIQTLTLDVAFNTGLTVVLATGTAADITVSYL
jgi:hypothetical protein